MGGHGEHTALQRARSDGRNIIDETLLGQLREFHTHIAAARDNVITFEGESCAQNPVAMRAHLQHLLSRTGFDRAHGVIRAAKSDQLAVRRPTDSVQRVIADRSRNRQFAFGDIPHLELAQTRRIATGDCKRLTVRREAH